MKTLHAILATAALGSTLLLAQAPVSPPLSSSLTSAGPTGPQRLGDQAEAVIVVNPPHHHHHHHHHRPIHHDDRG